MKHTFAGKSTKLSRLPVYADTCVPHMWLCTTHTYAHKAPERQTFSSSADEMWIQVTMATAALPSPTRVCWPRCIVENCLVWFLADRPSRGNAGNPTVGPIAGLRSSNRKKVRVENTLQLFVCSQMSCWLSRTHVFKPKLLPFNMTFTHGPWLGPTLAKPHVVVAFCRFCFFMVLYSAMRCFQKMRNLSCAVKRFYCTASPWLCGTAACLSAAETRDGSISVCRCVGARARLTRSLKRS